MTLTVRLDSALASSLERYCTERGVTKSLVVQESLAVYLLGKQAVAASKAKHPRTQPVEEPSANYKAFAEAGLIGGVALGRGADKAAVRAQIEESFAQRKARRDGA